MYEVGYIVSYNNNYYVCMHQHDASLSNYVPGNNSQVWVKIDVNLDNQFSSEPSSRYNQRTELTKNSYQDTYATHQKPSNNRYRNQYDYDDDDDDDY